MQITLVALSGQTLPFAINDSFALQVKNSAGTYVNLFGGDITDLTIEVGAFGNVANVVNYTILAMGSLVRLAKEIYNGTISQDEDGNQIYNLLSSVLLGTWNDVPAASTWAGYSATETWANAQNLGLGDIDTPGLYTMENRASNPDTVYNIASDIANSAFGYLYEDNEGNIGYADADHRQTYLAANGYLDLSANHALGQGLRTTSRSGDVRNDIYINYGNNYGSQKTATSATSIALTGASFNDFQLIVDVPYRGAFAPAPVAMWTDNWTNFNPQNSCSKQINIVGNHFTFFGMSYNFYRNFCSHNLKWLVDKLLKLKLF